MRGSAALAVLCLVVCSPSLASEPGQPLDCSDWVFLEPGLSCTIHQCEGEACISDWNNKEFDNQGRMIGLWRTLVADNVPCGASTTTIYRVELRAYQGADDRLLGYVEERCADVFGAPDRIWVRTPGCSGNDECEGELRFNRTLSR